MTEFQLYRILMCDTWLNSSRRAEQKLKNNQYLKSLFTPEKGLKLKQNGRISTLSDFNV